MARIFYENHQGNTIKASSDPLHIHGGPITRARAKNMQAALNGLIEKIWMEMQFKMQDIMNWAWREDKALWPLFKLLGSQIHNLDQMKKGKIWNKSGID